MADIQRCPGDPVPALVGNHRPDVSVHVSAGHLKSLAEAKASLRDLESERTQRQLRAFIGHLERRPQGLFVLTLPGPLASHGRTLLRMIATQECPVHTVMAVYDGLDVWRLPPGQDRSWRLD